MITFLQAAPFLPPYFASSLNLYLLNILTSNKLGFQLCSNSLNIIEPNYLLPWSMFLVRYSIISNLPKMNPLITRFHSYCKHKSIITSQEENWKPSIKRLNGPLGRDPETEPCHSPKHWGVGNSYCMDLILWTLPLTWTSGRPQEPY